MEKSSDKRKRSPTDFMLVIGAQFVTKYTVTTTLSEFVERLRNKTKFLTVVHGETKEREEHAHIFFFTNWPHKMITDIKAEFKKTGVMKSSDEVHPPKSLVQWITNSREKIAPTKYEKVARSMVCRDYTKTRIDPKFHPSTARSTLHGLIHKNQHENQKRTSLCCFTLYLSRQEVDQKLKFSAITKPKVKLEQEKDEDVEEEEQEQEEEQQELNKENNPLLRLDIKNPNKIEAFKLLDEYITAKGITDLDDFSKIAPLEDRV